MASSSNHRDHSPEFLRLRAEAAMGDDDSGHEITPLVNAYLLHPWTLAPLLLTLPLLPFIPVASCGPSCARAVARLGLPEGTDLQLVFLLLSLLALPLGINAMWRLSAYYDQRRSWRVALKGQLDCVLPDQRPPSGVVLVMQGLLMALIAPLGVAVLGTPDEDRSRLDALYLLAMSWGLWHYGLSLIFDGCVAIVAGFDVRAERTRMRARSHARVQVLLRAQKRARGR